MHLLIVAAVLAAVGTANLIFAFTDPPSVLGSMFDGPATRVRFALRFVSDSRRVMVGRLLTGVAALLLAAVVGVLWARWPH